MNDIYFSQILNECISFQEDIINNIKRKTYNFSTKYKECYLIKGDWFKEFVSIVNVSNSEDKTKNEMINCFCNKIPENIINDIDSLIKNNCNFKI